MKRAGCIHRCITYIQNMFNKIHSGFILILQILVRIARFLLIGLVFPCFCSFVRMYFCFLTILGIERGP